VEKPERVLADLGLRIAELRHERGWTQAQLAERLDVTVRYVAHVESGVNVSVATLCGFARVLGVKTITLLEEPRSRAARRPGRPASTSGRRRGSRLG
jgi:transcriptional regulator with XRE-family HTH domain